MAYEIEKNIQVPKDYQVRGRHIIYPFNQMEKGDSFLIPEYSRTKMQCIGGAISVFKRNHKKNWKFIKMKEGNSIRVWRIK